MTINDRRGFFLTFEGLDGSGKSTQIRYLREWLEAQDLPYIVTRQPGGTPTGDRIRALLLDSKSSGIAPMTELAMMFADRAQSIQEIIAPALADGQIVVCDRYTDSTEAYQGGGRELGSHLVCELDRLLCGQLKPDLTFLLLPDLEESLARARSRNARATSGSGADEGRFEREQDSFFRRVYKKFLEIADREPVRVVVIEGDLDVEEVHDQVITALVERLKTWQGHYRTQHKA